MEESILDENERQTIQKIEHLVGRLMEKEVRPDAPFRLDLVISQLGPVAKRITHDPKENPGARPYGDEEGKVDEFGELFAQVFSLAKSMNVPFDKAIVKGLANWVLADWRIVQARGTEKEIRGSVVCLGRVRGTAFVVSKEHPLETYRGGGVVIMSHPDIEQANYIVEHKPAAVLTDQGGICCHMANIARANNIITVVGTGKATELIPHGAEVLVDAVTDKEDGIITFINNEKLAVDKGI